MGKHNSQKVLVLTLGSLDNDSRVQKEISILISIGCDVCSMSVNGTADMPFPHRRIRHKFIRAFRMPGISSLILHVKFFLAALEEARNCKILHCNDLETLPFGILLKFLSFCNKKVVYDAHEYETETLHLKGIKKLMMKVLEYILIKFTDKVITVSSTIAIEYQRLYGIQKPALVLNCPPYAELEKKDLFRQELGIRINQTIFLYQGGLNNGRGIQILLEAFERMESDRIVIVFMGYGSLEPDIKFKAQRHKNIFFREAVSPSILLNYTSSADYGISFIENSCLSYRYCLPNKLFEYLMAGIPVVTSNLEEMKLLVETYGVGVVAPENTVEGFLAAVDASTKLDYRELQYNVHQARKIFNWEAQALIIEALYKDLLN